MISTKYRRTSAVRALKILESQTKTVWKNHASNTEESAVQELEAKAENMKSGATVGSACKRCVNTKN